VRQTIRGGEVMSRRALTADVEGAVVSCEAEPTASWFAHGRNNQVWLLRLRLKRDDGEIVALNLDDASVITIVSPAPAAHV